MATDLDEDRARELSRGLAEVQSAQAELLTLVDALQREPDQTRQAEIVRRIQERSDALRATASRVEEQAKKIKRESRGFVEVVLTPEQQRVVEDRTGTKLTTVLIADDSGGIVRAMPTMAPEQVLKRAIHEGERRAREGKARRAASEELSRIRDELKNAPEQIRRELERLLEDPEFMRAFER